MMNIFKARSEDPYQNFTELFKNVKRVKDATAAIRESYQATSKVLGAGAFGKVFLFKAKDFTSKKKYAVKVLLKESRS